MKDASQKTASSPFPSKESVLIILFIQRQIIKEYKYNILVVFITKKIDARS